MSENLNMTSNKISSSLTNGFHHSKESRNNFSGVVSIKKLNSNGELMPFIDSENNLSLEILNQIPESVIIVFNQGK